MKVLQVCFATFFAGMMMISCESKCDYGSGDDCNSDCGKIDTTETNPPQPQIYYFPGKWYTTDYNANHNDTIIFTENGYVENYFTMIHPAMYPESSYYFTYSLVGDSITFTYHFPGGDDMSETYKYFIWDNNKVTIKGFSNPFSDTLEAKSDVTFHRCVPPINQEQILGKWHLIQVSMGFAGIVNWQRGWITYEFKDNPKIVSVYLSENVSAVNQPFDAPIKESGDYTYFIHNNNDGNTIVFGYDSYAYGIRFSDGKLILDAGMAVDGNGYFFER